MSSKDNQRRSLAFLIIFFLGFIYIEKVLTPYLKGNIPSNATNISADAGSTNSELESDGNSTGPTQVGTIKSSTLGSSSNKSGSTNRVASQPVAPLLENTEIRDHGVYKIDTGLAHIEVSLMGGRVLSIALDNFKKDFAHDEHLYEMIVSDGAYEYPAGVSIGSESDLASIYKPIETVAGVDLANQNNKVITLNDALPSVTLKLRTELASGQEVVKIFTFHKDSYLFDLDVNTPASTEPIRFYWTNEVLKGDATLLDPYNFKGFVSYNGESSKRLSFADMNKPTSIKDLSGSKWVAVGDKYFATALLSSAPSGFTTARIEREEGNSFMELGGESFSELSIKIFSGPKSYTLLNDIGHELRRLLDLGKTGIISGPLLSLLNVFYKLVGNYGLAIVLLTIVVKLILYKLNTSQFKQMKAMQALKPELDKIKENIKDKQQQQAALMELYKKKGVNPLGGCLPVVIQMPVFIGLYSALSLAVELRHADFGGWVHDLSSPDALMIGGIAVPMLVVLFTLSMLVQQWVTPSTMDPQQKKIMMIMPVFMFFMFRNFPAGLAVYWLTNNLISIGQQQGMHYNDRSGKSGFKITAIVALSVFILAYIFTLT